MIKYGDKHMKLIMFIKTGIYPWVHGNRVNNKCLFQGNVTVKT